MGTRCPLPIVRGLLAILVVFFAAATAGSVRAEWPSNPALNLAVADGVGEQVLPKIAGTSDGGCYIGWFDTSTGVYNVRLQRLSPTGVELWGHNGILVSNQAQDTWITDWDLTVDGSGNCALVFSDLRGGTLDPQAYLFSPAGVSLWGPNGIALSPGTGFQPSPAVCAASDGDLVFAWGLAPDTGDGSIKIQRISPAGVLRYAPGGVVAATGTNESPAFPCLVPSLNGTVICSWVRDIRSYMSPRHFRARRFNVDGTPAWAANVAIFDALSLPMGYAPKIMADGAGGFVAGWHRASGNLFNSLVQRVNAAGTELFPHNGVTVSTEATRNHLDPTTCFRPATGEIFVFWNERNANQDQWGIYGQKFSSAGARSWTATGLMLLPVNAIYKSYPRSVQVGDGAICFIADEPTGQPGRERLSAYRLDNSGAMVWSGPSVVSSVLSGKSRLPVIIDPNGVTKICWEDDRNGNPDIYAQNLNPDGTLGATDPAGVPVASPLAARISNYPNPFHGSTEIVLSAIPVGGGDLLVTDARGALVRRLAVPTGGPTTARWDGRDESGRALPAGVYYYRLERPLGAAVGRAVLVR